MSTQKILSISGSPALSSFRRQKLLGEIRGRVPRVSSLHARFVHFIELNRQPLTDEESERLASILDYGAHDDESNASLGSDSGQSVLIVPRTGTVSPWSSKASDIAHHCGLSAISRIERGTVFYLDTEDHAPIGGQSLAEIVALLHDPMTQAVFPDLTGIHALFRHQAPAPLQSIPLSNNGQGGPDRGIATLEAANRDLGLALDKEEIAYLANGFAELGRDPTDVELMMFAQVNSEHCRHKIFNSSWVLDGTPQTHSLFRMIKGTHANAPGKDHILSAYADNAAVMRGIPGEQGGARFCPHPESRRYAPVPSDLHILMKVETHNHPTAISPYPGAATGSGGEIRDEAATGRGARAKAGLTGFSVSNLRIPGLEQPWEQDFGKPSRIASALSIMLEAPIGAAGFNNEFGRPALLGYFRTFETLVTDHRGHTEIRGYHKPIMVAGGMGNIDAEQIAKRPLPADAPVVVLGGPAMLIGLGGGAASSVASGTARESLDFASVQRENPEMQRRCQEVIDRCWQMGKENPILSIHDVGAGGLSNAVPELIHGGGKGGRFDLRAIPNDDPGMSPLALWCNESQERYVLALEPARLEAFLHLCRVEHCPCAVLGRTTDELRLVLTDALVEDDTPPPIDIPLSFLFGDPPRMVRNATRIPTRSVKTPEAMSPEDTVSDELSVKDAAYRVLRLPVVAGKGFLITIGDRSVTGLVARDQMVGPWQVPVADCAVTNSGFDTYRGEAMAMGERAPVALADAPASGRLAVAEAITNIACAAIGDLQKIALSANWMAACGHPGEDARLFDTVHAVTELCRTLGITIPVGKDSLSMKTVWEENGQSHSVTAPLSLIVSAFAPVADVRKTVTPQLRTDLGETDLILIDLGRGKNRLAGSAFAQTGAHYRGEPADLDHPEDLVAFFQVIQALNSVGCLLAYHDRSDGGLFTTLCEMAFAGHVGITVHLDGLGDALPDILFSEEPGAVLQVLREDSRAVRETMEKYGLPTEHVHVIGGPNQRDEIEFYSAGKPIFCEPRISLQQAWLETSYRMQALRDNPHCARQEFDDILEADDPGLGAQFGFDPSSNILHENISVDDTHADDIPGKDTRAPFSGGARPRMAILREQGVNGHVEMAAAFHRAGFDCFDVHMSDIIEGKATLTDYRGLAACGGFSYGDVLGAGGGWANSILYNSRARDAFAAFFERPDTFSLGVCNGCQMLSGLTTLIPGTEHWPRFVRNLSEQFEARLVLCEVLPSPSVLLADMAGSRLPIVVAHGEGRAEFDRHSGNTVTPIPTDTRVCLRYVDNRGNTTERYPANPNGSPGGVTGFTSLNGRVTIMMPHPERMFRSCQYSWHPDDWGEDGPWMRMFRNARTWVDGVVGR
uniref:Phosphoribosylformylglycinamidine synthase n=1 Tax=Candidatus Kentrum sp. FW TaxID=2126338 RepID=A0A450SU81_9GAMM|nr:MAG: phosphoribosylformylglycinamidine synthase [Candidatus Kentron sp. FW]VFJ60438.1 MAG: phosphoribosylformylglycinamidine synthase [Candidatus Kentron sp. FW]